MNKHTLRRVDVIKERPSHGDPVPLDWCFSAAAYPKDANVAQLFEAQVRRAPNALALAWDDARFTYDALNRRANQLAHHLRKQGVTLETPVSIFLPRSPALFLSELAICKAGGSYLPLDPHYPVERLQFMLEDARSPVMITESALAQRLPEYRGKKLLLEELAAELDAQPDSDLSHVARGEHRAYIMYTSGSTGRPKGSEILHRGISRLVLHTNYVQITESDRIGQVASPAFDAATFELWGALLNGASLIGVAKDIALSPRAFAAQIVKDDLTAMFLTAALFNLVASEVPTAFRGLRHLIVGGEALTPHWVRRVLRHGAPQHLVNGYGPTESTTFAAFHVIEKVAPQATSIPIGRPLANTSLFVLDAALQPVPIGAVGELYIGGDGLARGYLDRPELTRERFIDSPFGPPGERLYKTGDLARWLPDGVIDYVGRADQQVKIHGYRIELEEIQAVLLRNHAVQDVAVIVREDTPGDKRIVAYVTPRHKAMLGDARKLFELQSALKIQTAEKLPQCMVPSAFVFLDAIPITSNGKVNREALPIPHDNLCDSDATDSAPSTPTETTIAAIWCKLLGVRRASIHDSFIDQGGNSLLAAQLILQVQTAFDLEIPIHLFFQHPSIAQLAKKVDAMRTLDRGQTLSVSRLNIRSDATLDNQIQPAPRMAQHAHAPRNIFLTGATGFLGVYLLQKFLGETSANVHCLVRAKDAADGCERLRRTLQNYALFRPEFERRIIPVCGDLKQPLLGLDAESFDQLAERIDVIYHSAARINYVEPYSEHRRPNVFGTHEVLRLACHRVNKPLHYISSVGIFGPAAFLGGLTDLFEDTSIDACARYLAADLGYSQSKWVCEKLVFAARKRGLPISIYRPGFIMGSSQTGHCNHDDFVARILVGCIEMGRYPRLGLQKKEFIPVDYASDAIFHLSRKPSCLGGIFHIVPPTPQQSVTMEHFFGLISDCGYPMESVPYAAWKSHLRDFVSRDSGRSLLPLVPMLTERVHKGALTRWELYQPEMNFHSHNTTQGLAGSPIRYPAMDKSLVKTYLSYFVRAGHLRAAAGIPLSVGPAAAWPIGDGERSLA